MAAGVLRWWHTVRYLRPVQIYGRLWFRLHRPGIDASPAPALRSPGETWPPPIRRNASLIHEETFRFLNEEHALADLHGWDDPAIGKLWRYNLHYFDDLMAEGAESRKLWHQALLLRWLRENPPGKGTGWEPYPTSLRLVNWLRWHLEGNSLPEACVHSAAMQTRWLIRRMEYHLLGNHLWANAKALVFAGACFQGPEADAWRDKGLGLLQRELRELVLPDGGHFERSPMYHAIMLADLLDLLALDRALPGVLPGATVAAWCSMVPAMMRWLAAMSHPDGEIALFNDAALGIAPKSADFEAGARRLNIDFDSRVATPLHDLSDSGYTRMQIGPAVLIADTGPIGPDYIPGHAHADTLSFELSLHGQRVIVDSGTSRYDISAERLRQRGTAAHNTVQLEGLDSSEVWGSFRVARRARPIDRRLSRDESGITLECGHDGYRHLPGRPLHRRQWQLQAGRLVVRDTIEGQSRQAVARFHFHPAVKVVAEGANRGRIELPGGPVIGWEVTGGRQCIASSRYHPEFNVSQPNQCLEVTLDGSGGEVIFTWPNLG
jgi:uncharacterized heparinase superfamily protein